MHRASACELVYCQPRIMVSNALRRECMKSTASTTSVHVTLRTSSSLWSSAVAVAAMFSLGRPSGLPVLAEEWLPLSSHTGMFFVQLSVSAVNNSQLPFRKFHYYLVYQLSAEPAMAL